MQNCSYILEYFESWRFKLPGSVPSRPGNCWKYIKSKSLPFPKAIITAISATAHYHFRSTCQTFSPNDPWLDGHIIDESCIVFRQIRVVLDRYINLRRTAFHSTFPSLLLPETQSSYYFPLLEPLLANQGV